MHDKTKQNKQTKTGGVSDGRSVTDVAQFLSLFVRIKNK